MFGKNNLFLARLPRISANPNENYTRYNFHAFANISRNFGKFPEISENIKFPENLQPNVQVTVYTCMYYSAPAVNAIDVKKRPAQE